MKMFLSLMLSASFVSSLFSSTYHPINLCYEGSWEESCPSMDCCTTLSANSPDQSSLNIEPSDFEGDSVVIDFKLPSKKFEQNTCLPPNRALLWLTQKISLP